MKVDGRVVSRTLAEAIRPALRNVGFSKFEGRNSWRRNRLSVDLVTFPSMSSYVAQGVGCTSFSFTGEVSVYYSTLEDRPAVEWPKAWESSLRGSLGKTIPQPFFRPYGHSTSSLADRLKDRPDVWFVLEDGGNLDDVVEDALAVLRAQGLPFIELMDEPMRAADYLSSVQSQNIRSGEIGTALLGRLGSPWRLRSINRLRVLEASGDL